MKLKKIMDKTLETAAIFSFFSMILVVLAQVFSRFALPKAPPWTEEAARIFFIFTVSFAGGLAIKEKAFVNVDTFILLLPKKAAKIMEILINIVIIAFMGIISFKSFDFIKIGAIQKSPTLYIPMSYIFSSTFIVSFFIGLYSFIELINNIRALKERSE